MLIHKKEALKIAGENVVLRRLEKELPHIPFLSALLLAAAFLFFGTEQGNAQGNITFDLKKPKAYENRKLASELTPEKKINPVKRIRENVVSHYNFYFNANLKIQDVLKSARQSHKDTFIRLLPFYDYTLDQTLARQQDLDSVVIKANNGILLHDLRSDWVDDLYFLMGQSYFYQKKFDSAYDVFQYINYNFQPRSKSERGYEKNIGSNFNTGGNAFTISSPENKLISGTLVHRPIRNDALVWIARTLMEQGNDDDARAMMETLSRDANFPDRLQNHLAELKAYWFYRRNEADSAAYFLDRAMGNCETNQDKARRCFLVAQLYSSAGKKDLADRFYERAVSLTTDPVLEAYARINQIGLSDEADKEKKVDQNVKALVQMAGREKYTSYRSIIFNAAAEMELSRKNKQGAIDFYIKSNAENATDQQMRSQNHVNIAELAFETQQFTLAKKHYDSIDLNSLKDPGDIVQKKAVVSLLSENLNTISLEDSLQKIAAMSEKERGLFLEDLLKKKKKEKGIPVLQEDTKGSEGKKNLLLDEQQNGTLFPTTQKKGEWYFNNPSLISQGKIAFKNKWGTRPNVDNWRRSSVINANLRANNQKNLLETSSETQDTTMTELSMEGLMANLPLTEALLKLSKDRKFNAYRKLAILYNEKLGDCASSVLWNEKLISEVPDHPELEKILYELTFCYGETKNESKASFYKNQLLSKFPSGQSAMIIKDPASFARAELEEKQRSTQAYQKIYDLFLSGQFNKALEEKKKADAVFGENRWSAQLLYIESIYYVRTAQDSLAVATLNKIPQLYPESPMAERAGQLADVVNRRKEIEAELSGMEVTRVKEDTLEMIDDSRIKETVGVATRKDTVARTTLKPAPIPFAKSDSLKIRVQPAEVKGDGYVLNTEEPHAVMIMLNNVDIVYVNEAKRALSRYAAERYTAMKLTITQEKAGTNPLLLISSFANLSEALAFMEKTAAITSKEIMPWLPADKYKYLVISPANLVRLKETNAPETYINFLRQQFPGKF